MLKHISDSKQDVVFAAQKVQYLYNLVKPLSGNRNDLEIMNHLAHSNFFLKILPKSGRQL